MAQPDSYSIPHDKVFNLPAPGVLANDDNFDGDPLTAKLVSVPNNGKVNFNPDGSFSYTPNPGFAGFDNFTYSVSDGASPSPPVPVNLNVINFPPAGQPDNYSIPHDKVFNLPARGVLANDDDLDGDPLTAKLVSVPNNGKVNFNPDGSFSYTPNPGFAGFDNFTYSVSDGASPSPPVPVNLNVINFPPAGQPDNYSIPHDKVFNLPAPGVLANDDNLEGDTLTAKLVSLPNEGKVVFNSDGSFSYTPNPGFAGFDNFSYSVSDGASPSPPISVNLNVTNQPPGPQPDSYSIPHNKVLNLSTPGVLANDDNYDGDPQTAKLLSVPSNGKLNFKADGSFSYTPNPGFAGFDNFTYSVSDGASPSPPVPVNLNVTNFPPALQPDIYSTSINTVLNVSAIAGVLSNDIDFEGDPLTATLSTGPSSGKVVFNKDGSFSYNPNPGYFGPDSFIYSVSDGVLPSGTVTVNIDINNLPTNQPPVVNSDNYTTPHDKTLNIPIPGVLVNDIDSDGDPLTAKLQSGPSNGKVIFNADGSFSYTPNPGFAGPDNFSYSVTDGITPSVFVPVNLNVTNQPPQANRDSYNTPHDKTLNVLIPGVLVNDIDPDGDTLTAKLESGPSNGKLNFNADGSFSYTPNPGFAGPDNFSYSITDGAFPPFFTTVPVNLNVTNQPPQANSDSYNTPHDKTLNVLIPGVLANDIDPDGDTLTAKLESAPSNGKVIFNADGSFSYTPNPGFAGFDNFSYSITDGAFPPFFTTVPVNLNVTNQPPQANSDSYNTPHDKTLNVLIPGVLANDIDPDGDTLTAKLESAPSNGKVIFNADGSFSYTPNPGFAGFDNFSYSITDGAFPPFFTTVPVNLNVTNQPPQANSDSYNTPHDKTLNVLIPGVLANDIDPDGDTLTAKLVSLPNNGKINFNPDGSFSYTPNPGFVGLEEFSYSVSDGTFTSASAVIGINVTNQPPQANSDSYKTLHDRVINVPVAEGVLAKQVGIPTLYRSRLVWDEKRGEMRIPPEEQSHRV